MKGYKVSVENGVGLGEGRDLTRSLCSDSSQSPSVLG